ncbi:MAG: polyprenol monophosphomannose synthase [Melioribacteraceae bacterium]|nr:polyprenol monophosphomannose synthase [Melioribacteraceae bacterium]WKZ70513.1 MAG: polyprenol monophosphomannose synthase [Melioribacteraceae bacterium]
MKKTLIIIPTYNELNNIQKLVPLLRSEYPQVDVLVVDDNSPDGTGKKVLELAESDPQIHLIEREGKLGLGTAYVRGFKFALENGYEAAMEMDADFSHDPKEVKNFLREIEENDLVIGSRYIKGVNVVNWPMSRLLLSYFANIYTKVITGMPIYDATGGFKCFRREVLESINLDKITSNGYSFQIEMNFKTWKKGFRVKEIPIIFVDRADGSSKMSKHIVYEAIFMVWKLRFASMFGYLD